MGEVDEVVCVEGGDLIGVVGYVVVEDCLFLYFEYVCGMGDGGCV